MQEHVPNNGPVRSRTALICGFALFAAAIASVLIFAICQVSAGYLPGLAEQYVPDRVLAPATKAFLSNFLQAASLLAAFLSLVALIADYLPRNRRTVALTILVCSAAFLHWVYYVPLTIDDAYISLVYARNLSLGRGLVFNIGERVEGYTNLLWVLLETCFFKLRLNAVAGAKIAGLACGLGVLWLMYRISRLQEDREDYIHFLAPLLLVISAPFATASALGLETQLFTLLILAASYRYLKSETATPGYSVSLLLAMATLTRPEGVLFFAAIFGHSFLRQLFGKRVSPKFVLSILPYAAILAIHILWRYSYYGSFLPNTYYAKLEGSPWRIVWGYWYVKRFFVTYGGSIFILCALPFVKRERFGRNSLLFLLVVPFLGYVACAGGDWIPRFRFIEPVMPYIFLLLAEAMNDLLIMCHKHVRASLWSKAVMLMLLGFVAHFYFADTVELHTFAMLRARGAKLSHVFLGKWLKANTDTDESIALMDIGMIKYYSDRELVDISGLTDAHVARLPGGFLKKAPDLRYLLDRNPKYVILVSHNDIRRNDFESSYIIDKKINDDPLFHQKYRFLFSLDHLYLRENPSLSDGYYMNVFVKREESGAPG